MATRSRTKILLKRTVATLAVLVLLAVVAIGVRALSDDAGNSNSNSNNTAGNDRRAAQTIPVEIVTVELRDLHETIRGIGTLQAARTVHLAPEIDGILIAIHFRDGELVEEGRVLFELDDRKLRQRLQSQQSALRAARARLDIARTTFDRVEQLRQQSVASTDEFDRARTDLDAAVADVEQFEANVALVEAELQDARFYAPFTGMMSERYIDAGNYVQVGQRLATLYQTDPLEMNFRLPERHLGRVQIGQPVQVLVASYPDERFEGEVAFVSPAVNEQSRDFLVKANIDNQDLRLRPGSFGTAVVVVAERERRPVVPEQTIVPTRTGHSVFIIDEEQRARLTSVSIGLRTNGMVEITEGLTGGETVVRTGQLRLSDGTAVEFVQRD